jgi:S-adenosyl methyltransferase
VDEDLRIDVPHPARVYDFLLGGKTNYAADRAAAEAGIAANPDSLIPPRTNRDFLRRVVTHLVREAGVRQFLDIGTGIPTEPNVHRIAQTFAPDARVVYVDNDPIVLAHARALLASGPEGRTAFVKGDLRDPEQILDSAQLRETLDTSRPIGLLLIAVLHFVGDADDPYGATRRLVEALPPGSYVALSHLTGDFVPEKWAAVEEVYRRQNVTMQVRSKAEVARFLDGLDPVPPGLEIITRWHPEPSDIEGGVTDAQVSVYGAVARKP